MNKQGQNRRTFVYTVATQFPTLDYSHGLIPLFWFAEEYIRTKVARHTNDEYELFSCEKNRIANQNADTIIFL